MSIGLGSPSNKKKHAPRGTFTLHTNSVDEDTAAERANMPHQEYPKYIADVDAIATDAAHEQELRAKAKAAKKADKGKKADKE